MLRDTNNNMKSSINNLRFTDTLIFSLVSLPVTQAVYAIGEDIVLHRSFPALYGLIGVIFGCLFYVVMYGLMGAYIVFPFMVVFWLLRGFLGSRYLSFLASTTGVSTLLIYGPFAAQSNLGEIRFSLPGCIITIVIHLMCIWYTSYYGYESGQN